MYKLAIINGLISGVKRERHCQIAIDDKTFFLAGGRAPDDEPLNSGKTLSNDLLEKLN